MWPSPCSPTRTLPSLGTYSRSSGPLSPVASRMTGSPDETAGARDHGAGWTQGGGLALGLGEALGLGDGRAPAVLEEHAARTSAAARSLSFLATLPAAPPGAAPSGRSRSAGMRLSRSHGTAGARDSAA